MAVIKLELPSNAEREQMVSWLIENVGPLNPQRKASHLAVWGMNWYMKTILDRNEGLKFHVVLPDDNIAVMFRLACSK